MIAHPPRYLSNGPFCRGSIGTDLGVRPLLAFLSYRIVRTGPRLVIHLTLCLLGILFLTRYLPQSLSDVAFGTTYTRVWNWEAGGAEDCPPDDGSVGGGLRIVLFGENSILNPSESSNGNQTVGSSWTEALCRELNCSSYFSFVPKLNSSGRSLISNALYSDTLERVLNASAKSESPGMDYSFLSNHYPVQWDIPDLNAQIEIFLSLNRPTRPPKETLWVFNFGMWDVWTLAAFPRTDALPLIDELTAHLFRSIERLFKAAMDETSPAYSNFSTRAEIPGTEPDLKQTAEHDMIASDDDEITEPFRVLIPSLLDPSLLPGWQTNRLDSPKIHSKAEQMRNAAKLTEQWNRAIVKELESWVRTPNPEPLKKEISTGNGESTAIDRGNKEASRQEDWRTIHKAHGEERRPSKQRSRIKRDLATSTDKAEAASSILPSPNDTQARNHPYPQRDGIAYDLAAYILDVTMERQLRKVGLKDAEGNGDNADKNAFIEVLRPCIQEHGPASTDSEANDGWMGDMIQKGKEVIEYSEDEPPRSDDGPEPERHETRRDVLSKRRDDRENSRSTRSDKTSPSVCETPHEYLFYTSFTLGQRAIYEIARQSADMVRRNQSLRASWDHG